MAKYVYAVGFTPRGFVMVHNRKRNGWEFPGGSVEPGESDAEAAVREFREETGRNLDVIGSVTYPDGGVVFIGLAGEPTTVIIDDAIDDTAVFEELPEGLAFPREEYEGILARARAILGHSTN